MAATAGLRVAIGFILALTVIAISPADARKHHNAKSTSDQTVMKADGKPVAAQKRDPADVALDRRIKGICRGC